MKKFIALYMALVIVMFFLLSGCATGDKGQEEGGGYADKFEETQLTPSSMPATEEAPWEAQ